RWLPVPDRTPGRGVPVPQGLRVLHRLPRLPHTGLALPARGVGGAGGGTQGRAGAAGEAVPAVLLGYDGAARTAHDYRHRRGAGDRGAGEARPLLAGLLLAGGRDGPLLALRRYGVDFSAADALPARHAHRGGPALLRGRTWRSARYPYRPTSPSAPCWC